MLLLPVGITSDTLAVYWRSHLLPFHGEVFDSYLVNTGSHLVHSAWLVLTRPLLGPVDELWTHPWWWEDSFGLVPQHLEAFLARPDAWRVITVLKLPYVAAEIAAGLLLLWIVWGRADGATRSADVVRRSRRLWAFWMLSPAGLYATLLFARYEAYPVLAIVLTVFWLQRDRPLLAALALGVGITLRTYPLAFVPVLALVVHRDLPRQLGWSAVALAPFAVTMALNRLIGGTVGELARVGDFSFGDNWFGYVIQGDRGGADLLVFAIGLGALGAYLLGRARGWFGRGPVPRADAWAWLVVAHLLIFALAPFSAHYLMWLTPAVALAVGLRDRPGVVALHVASVAAIFGAAFLLWGGGLFSGTLGGLGPTARTLLPIVPSGGHQLASILWSAFVVATAAIAIPFVRDTLARDPAAPAPPVEPSA